MKNVLFVINTLGRAGAETAMLELLRCIDHRKYNISVYVLTNQGELAKELPPTVHLLNCKYSDCSVLTSSVPSEFSIKESGIFVPSLF